jgi:hypothetical protein
VAAPASDVRMILSGLRLHFVVPILVIGAMLVTAVLAACTAGTVDPIQGHGGYGGYYGGY